RTQCGVAIAAYNGSAATVNTAITACGDNQYVLLGPGTFNLGSGIDFGSRSNVTRRGSGPNRTFLIFTGNVKIRKVRLGPEPRRVTLLLLPKSMPEPRLKVPGPSRTY